GLGRWSTSSSSRSSPRAQLEASAGGLGDHQAKTLGLGGLGNPSNAAARRQLGEAGQKHQVSAWDGRRRPQLGGLVPQAPAASAASTRPSSSPAGRGDVGLGLGLAASASDRRPAGRHRPDRQAERPPPLPTGHGPSLDRPKSTSAGGGGGG